MKKNRAACSILFILLAFNAACAGDADSTATRDNLNLNGELGFSRADSTQPEVADTLSPAVIGERGVLDRLILPTLVTAAMGGLLILLFTQRG